MPFGLPRELVTALGLARPTGCRSMRPLRPASRVAQIRDPVRCLLRGAAGGRQVRASRLRRPAGSSPSMKWVNPPVAYMLHAGVPLLLGGRRAPAALHPATRCRIALEGYPGPAGSARVLGSASVQERRPPAPDAAAADRAARTSVDGARAGTHAPGTCACGSATRSATSSVDDATGDRLGRRALPAAGGLGRRAAPSRRARQHRSAGGMDHHGRRCRDGGRRRYAARGPPYDAGAWKR
jgi:hypothetical protein